MRFVLLFISFLTINFVFSHDYYVSLSELEYNELTQRLEGSIRFTTHDVEKAIEIETGKPIHLEGISVDSSADFRRLESFLNSGIHFLSKEQITIGFHLEAILVQLNGISECFFSTDKLTTSNVQVRMDFLMKQFPAQQNKLTFILREQKRSYVFLKPDQVHELILISN